MTQYEYRVVPAPERGRKSKGVKGAEGRFAFALEHLMNEMAGDGWEYQRAETLPSEERQGLTGKTTVYHNVLVFRRPVEEQIGAFKPRELDPPKDIPVLEAARALSVAELAAREDEDTPEVPDGREVMIAEDVMHDPMQDSVLNQPKAAIGREVDDTQNEAAADTDHPHHTENPTAAEGDIPETREETPEIPNVSSPKEAPRASV